MEKAVVQDEFIFNFKRAMIVFLIQTDGRRIMELVPFQRENSVEILQHSL